MANPSGNPKTLVVPQRADNTAGELAEKPIAVRLPVKIDTVVRALPNITEFVRAAIAEKAEREGLI